MDELPLRLSELSLGPVSFPSIFLAVVSELTSVVFQLTYTTLFGWFATYSYLRTASVLPALASHAYCNVMGIYLPNVAAQRHPGRKGLIWGMYGLGIAGFVVGLRRL